MIYADLDGMKKINDTYGHPTGDHALVAMADILRKTFRSADVIARIGGDEFAVFAPSTSAEHEANILARFQRNIDGFHAKAKAPFKLAVSIGAVPYDPDQPCSMAELIARADKAMYEQKRVKESPPPHPKAPAPRSPTACESPLPQRS